MTARCYCIKFVIHVGKLVLLFNTNSL